MTSRHTLRAAAVAAAALAAAACSKDPVIVGVVTPTSAPFMARYVALGNSITAGYQSGGINDSTQRRSYARMLALAAGATYRYASLTNPGCPPPIVNFVTGDRGTGNTATTCLFRDPASITSLLNNVAVPGANSLDPTGLLGVTVGTGNTAVTYTGGYNILTNFILGSRTQVERAVQLDPTFASIWIGNNDVLSFAIGGTTAGTTPVATFVSNYASMVNTLRAGSPNLQGGVLIGVVDVTNIPLLIPISVINPASNGTGANAFQQAALVGVRTLFGATTPGVFTGPRPATFAITFNANCNASTAEISILALQQIAAAVPATAPGFPFNCAVGNGTAAGTGATSGLLDDAERKVFVDRVTAYNAYIKAKADSIGFAYLDPNALLTPLKQQGVIPPFPNLAVPTAAFATAAGTAQQVRFITNDGVHPSTTAHYVLANALIDLINTKYTSSIRKLTPADTVSGL